MYVQFMLCLVRNWESRYGLWALCDRERTPGQQAGNLRGAQTGDVNLLRTRQCALRRARRRVRPRRRRRPRRPGRPRREPRPRGRDVVHSEHSHVQMYVLSMLCLVRTCLCYGLCLI